MIYFKFMANKKIKEIRLAPKVKREHRIVISLNDKEKIVLDNFCKKYKIEKKAKFVRETLFTAILKRLDEDYPTLFDEKEMR